jgi:hypothetical protein
MVPGEQARAVSPASTRPAMARARNILSPLAGLFSPTSQLTREGRARRRYNCEKQSEWDDRAEKAIALLMEHHDAWRPVSGPAAIADFGAGNERLRPLLESRLEGEVEYHPYDLHPQLPTTQQLNVSQGLPARDFDVAICLGLLEYLPSIRDLTRNLQATCRFVLNSYVTSDSAGAIPYDDRLRQGWTTHMTAAEVEQAFDAAGFRLAGRSNAEGVTTTVWLWEAGGALHSEDP